MSLFLSYLFLAGVFFLANMGRIQALLLRTSGATLYKLCTKC